MAAADYKGVDLQVLRVGAIEWSDDAADHIRTRTTRKGANEFNIEPEWATEAALDPRRLVTVQGEVALTQSLKIVGFSPSTPPDGRLLKVWIWSDDPETSDEWQGGSAAPVNKKDHRRYEEER